MHLPSPFPTNPSRHRVRSWSGLQESLLVLHFPKHVGISQRVINSWHSDALSIDFCVDCSQNHFERSAKAGPKAHGLIHKLNATLSDKSLCVCVCACVQFHELQKKTFVYSNLSCSGKQTAIKNTEKESIDYPIHG